jgi:hypothetical protein
MMLASHLTKPKAYVPGYLMTVARNANRERETGSERYTPPLASRAREKPYKRLPTMRLSPRCREATLEAAVDQDDCG